MLTTHSVMKHSAIRGISVMSFSLKEKVHFIGANLNRIIFVVALQAGDDWVDYTLQFCVCQIFYLKIISDGRPDQSV